MNINFSNPVLKNGGITTVRALVDGEVFELNRQFLPYEERHRYHIEREMYLEIMGAVYDKLIKET